MIWLRTLLTRLFCRKTDWNSLPWGKPAIPEDDLAQLNDERL